MSTLGFVALAVISLLIGLTYVTLGYKAREHLNEHASSSDRSIGWLFWWSFETKKYDDKGKRLCRVGHGLAIIIIALYVIWFVVLR
jgi:hypothetical protein